MELVCRQIEVEDIIACSLGLKKSEYNVFETLLRQDHVTIKELSSELNLDRTTLQKVLKGFVSNDLVLRYQENLDNGGYVFLYKIRDKVILKRRIHAAIDKWHNTARQAVEKW